MYIDSSVLLRVVLGERRRLPTWKKITQPVSSELIRLECLRTIDRARVRLGVADEAVSRQRADVAEALATFHLVAVDSAVLDRAADPFPTTLGSLDSIHLASALLAKSEFDDLALATHDVELATAARAMGFQVHGGE